ncbi:MAG: hypothetical protein IKS49_06680 [Actinomycetaceae bacterium]|nr:hypothetical protein [Actinomycetaceae bacterium]
MVKKILIGLILGVLTGLLGVAAHAGFVDIALLGLFLALVFVAAGAWFTIEWFDTIGWLVYLIALFAVTAFLLFAPPAGDMLVTPQKWVSEAYVVLAPIAAIIPAVLVTWINSRRCEE